MIAIGWKEWKDLTHTYLGRIYRAWSQIGYANVGGVRGRELSDQISQGTCKGPLDIKSSFKILFAWTYFTKIGRNFVFLSQLITYTRSRPK